MNGGGLGKSRPLAVPEPKHRIGPQGSSSGQSVRKFPKSCVQQVSSVMLGSLRGLNRLILNFALLILF